MMEHDLIDIKLIKQKIQHYCSIQERCRFQVVKKLYTFGAVTSQISDVLVELQQDNFLNEERFARSYCSGKFKINKWGKQKIAFELSKLQISKHYIRKGMTEIDEKDYFFVMKELAKKKYNSLSGTDRFKNKKKVANYLLNKGFESELIWTYVNQL